MTISKALIQQLREASAKATQGPWRCYLIGMIEETMRSFDFLSSHNRTPYIHKDNAEFIALARNHLDSLLDEIERLERLEYNYTLRLKEIEEINDNSDESKWIYWRKEGIVIPKKIGDLVMTNFKDKLSGEAIKYSSDKCPAFISNIDQREAVRDFVYEACLHSAQWAVDEVLRMRRSDEAEAVILKTSNPLYFPCLEMADYLESQIKGGKDD